MDWSVVVTLVLGSSVVAVLTTKVVDLLAFRNQRKSRAGYLAIRVAIAYETFAQDCANVVSDIRTFKESKGAGGESDPPMPNLPELPTDDDLWRSLDPKFVARVLGLPNKLKESLAYIHYMADSRDPDDGTDVYEQAVLRGHEAAVLSRELREGYCWPRGEPLFDHEGVLKDAVDEINAKKMEMERRVEASS